MKRTAPEILVWLFLTVFASVLAVFLFLVFPVFGLGPIVLFFAWYRRWGARHFAVSGSLWVFAVLLQSFILYQLATNQLKSPVPLYVPLLVPLLLLLTLYSFGDRFAHTKLVRTAQKTRGGKRK